MTEGQPITSTTLLSSIAYSVALSVVADDGAALLAVPPYERALNYHRTPDLMEGIPRRTSPESRPQPIACTQQPAPSVHGRTLVCWTLPCEPTRSVTLMGTFVNLGRTLDLPAVPAFIRSGIGGAFGPQGRSEAGAVGDSGPRPREAFNADG
jgi:hypothetical protein